MASACQHTLDADGLPTAGYAPVLLVRWTGCHWAPWGKQQGRACLFASAADAVEWARREAGDAFDRSLYRCLPVPRYRPSSRTKTRTARPRRRVSKVIPSSPESGR